jgi:hypothetical protein
MRRGGAVTIIVIAMQVTFLIGKTIKTKGESETQRRRRGATGLESDE